SYRFSQFGNISGQAIEILFPADGSQKAVLPFYQLLYFVTEGYDRGTEKKMEKYILRKASIKEEIEALEKEKQGKNNIWRSI
ncbi:MAG: hypothetical protein LBG96_11405, partial [Tannerella sp.]|nr:hypothetical protein [Tannerella sp.]